MLQNAGRPVEIQFKVKATGMHGKKVFETYAICQGNAWKNGRVKVTCDFPFELINMDH
jgi:hypothetical protein